ncbi:MAG: HNH endonuclease [Patescibacteria group bacterium]|nr:HNH endonuclease [Patescibacteria group bacterium]
MGDKSKGPQISYARRFVRAWLKERGITFPSSPPNRDLAAAVVKHPDAPEEVKSIIPTRKAVCNIAAILKAANPTTKIIRFPRGRGKLGGITLIGDRFYDSDEWKRLRFRALEHYGRRCACCGATTDDGKKLHVDHIKPKSRYPELALCFENLQILCEDCNIGKGASSETDFRRSSEAASALASCGCDPTKGIPAKGNGGS